MNTPLFSLGIRRKRDVVIARQRARQIGRLVGLAPGDQATLACVVFEQAWQALQQDGRADVVFSLGERALQVRFHTASARREGQRAAAGLPLPAGPCLERPLPESLPTSREDLPWIIRQVASRTSVNCFEEMQQQNQEMLRLLLDLRQSCTPPVEAAARPRGATAA